VEYRPRNKALDSDGNPDHVMSELGYDYGYVRAVSYLTTLGVFYRRLINSNSSAGSAALAEVCALLSVILVFIL